ncbi:MAG: 50S ribosomal protein L31 [Candidatus Doudnabacteria bacterium RIFCSPLOWO2_02_FULL_48_8]|uniref:Large ribosomal subunit protein bL31 n=1 Tax=Candidatus Doudnabacteria bacterium RIFCSPHIGHO2_01_FULL_46_24 TaxID=1817825 RepID=A0A1F5NWK5_9BACT|nr:MAG: 50S ribosomal protein L31 [Candidatus Doudnabacteria bacterium RIFCSPHIGHO2_01_FULL_46_24]OGE95162.1 MAG: 50S ribosomal protein L31 [Candidatus Doudnabacteria bacterium RIFCSPLOWO2_02_FULL_48_8]OGE95369.1 MAG: 50S ribosomal protein L31 [Candidatus Doudnabacteria bacterium RIFCSPHIGHO2_12_FULL_48_11]
MKNIHPQYFSTSKVVCACGNSFTTGSTKQEMHVEICSNCHPFYTGKQMLIDTAGIVEKFRSRAAKAKIKLPKKTKA